MVTETYGKNPIATAVCLKTNDDDTKLTAATGGDLVWDWFEFLIIWRQYHGHLTSAFIENI